jgi:hypothetical protein
MKTGTSPHQRAVAERHRLERWHDLRAALAVVGLVWLVLRWLPGG